MTPLVWFAIFGGLAIVILAVGIPYLLTHKRMSNPYDTSEGEHYLQAKRRWWQRGRGNPQPVNPGSQEGASGSLPNGTWSSGQSLSDRQRPGH